VRDDDRAARAALRADEIAAEADFFSFGTNDLTQTTLGFSRDDAEGKFLTYYLEHGILERNPFEVLDEDGVATSCASRRARARREAGTQARDLRRARGEPRSSRSATASGSTTSRAPRTACLWRGSPPRRRARGERRHGGRDRRASRPGRSRRRR
jgi:hypothetical protein